MALRQDSSAPCPQASNPTQGGISMPAPLSPTTRLPGLDPDSGNPLPGLGWGVLGGLGLWTLLVRSALALWHWVCP
jgi:hypothetical protein